MLRIMRLLSHGGRAPKSTEASGCSRPATGSPPPAPAKGIVTFCGSVSRCREPAGGRAARRLEPAEWDGCIEPWIRPGLARTVRPRGAGGRVVKHPHISTL